MQKEIPNQIIKRFEQDIKKHALSGIPVQHLTGYEYFYERKFTVNRHVLIPRFETEELVQHVIGLVQKYHQNEQVTIVDVGTGSGIIGITLALELTNAIVYATDISVAALHTAKNNAKLHHAEVRFLQGDFLQPVIDSKINPHYIISNPPYISEEEKRLLKDTVKDFDPELALFATDHGLGAYKKILSQINLLPEKQNRYICLEIGHTQASAVTCLIKQQLQLHEISTLQDINGKDRIISAHLQ